MSKRKKLLNLRSKIIDEIFKKHWEEVWFFPEYKEVKEVKGFLGTDPIMFVSINPSFGAYPSKADTFYYRNLKRQGFGNAHLTDVFKVKRTIREAHKLCNDKKVVKEAKRFLDEEIAIIKPKLIVCLGTSYKNFYKDIIFKGHENIRIIPHYAPQFNNLKKKKKFRNKLRKIREEYARPRVINLIKEYKEEILNKLSQDKKSFNNYNYISIEFKKGSIINNDKFKETYQKFYVLNAAGLKQELIDRYFKLLESKETDLKKILLELSKIPRRNGTRSVQLSFASKLIHTVTNTQPIFDKHVANILGIQLNNIKDINKRIEDRLIAYDLLKKKFAELIKNIKIKEIISEFKKRLEVDINDVKMLDFILWKLDKMKTG